MACCKGGLQKALSLQIHPFYPQIFGDEGKPGIEGVDTRMLTIKMRERGTMRAALITGSDDGEEAVNIARNLPFVERHVSLLCII